MNRARYEAVNSQGFRFVGKTRISENTTDAHVMQDMM